MIDGSLVEGLHTRSYVTQDNHRYLAEDAWRPEGPNIGVNGEHLTITFLSLNRSSLSERLVRSLHREIPNFAGEILAIDNGSSEDEIERLSAVLASLPFRSRLECLDRNYGVSGGRNRTMSFVKTPWVMSLDNDVIFVKNPIPQVQSDLALLGCHFMTLAVLNEDAETNFLRGGHLWLSLENGELVIGGGTAQRRDALAEDGPGYLATFMSGCASVFRVDTFRQQGGFDEGMFVGFEDFEFSLRLFRAGLKVGASDVRALVHDHPKPDTHDDQAYERARFARDRLLAAARHFEDKHGYRVWTPGVDGWVEQRQEKLKIGDNKTYAAKAVPRQKKPRIALISDIPEWALSNVAIQIERHLSDEFDFERFISSDLDDKPEILSYLTAEHDLTHYLWRQPLQNVASDWRRSAINLLFGDWQTFKQKVFAKPHTFTVYDHLYLELFQLKDRNPLFNELSVAYSVSSKKLERIYSEIDSYPNPAAITSDGVDLKLFQPRNLARLSEIGKKPLRVGWVGNSAWGTTEPGLVDPKGFHTILIPALNQLQLQGHAVDHVFADRQAGLILHRDMPDYYATIDVLVCTSLMEGTPNPVLEAMACGIPVVSTDVGIVSEAFGPAQSLMILTERSPNVLAEALERLITTKGLAAELSNENLKFIQSWDWSIRAQAFRMFFRDTLSKFASK